MEKVMFKKQVMHLLFEKVDGLSNEKKIKYMKKWIKDYESEKFGNEKKKSNTHTSELKIGVLVRTTFNEIVRSNSLSNEQIVLLQSDRYCKETFDLNYPMLLKVAYEKDSIKQRSVNGYPRYWSNPILILEEKFYVCNDWYDRNRTNYIKWVNQFS